MTRKPAIKPEDIQVTYNKSPNIKDMIIKTQLYKQHIPKCVNLAINLDVKHVYRWKPSKLLQTKPTIATHTEVISTANQQT